MGPCFCQVPGGKVFQDKRYKNRELQIMKELRHPNVVELKHAFYTSGDKPGETYLNVVMEYCSDTVYRVMKETHSDIWYPEFLIFADLIFPEGRGGSLAAVCGDTITTPCRGFVEGSKVQNLQTCTTNGGLSPFAESFW